MGNNLSMSDILVIAATLMALVLLMRRSSASFSHHYAGVRIRSDDNDRRRTPLSEPAEENVDPVAWVEWFLFGSLLLAIVMILGKI